MAYAARYSVSVTTASDGSATAYTSGIITGRVVNVIYTADGTTPYDNTVDITITGETSGIGVLTKANVSGSFTAAPVQPTHGNADGAASLYAAGGAAVNTDVFVAGERIKIVLAQGGNAKTGTFTFIIA